MLFRTAREGDLARLFTDITPDAASWLTPSRFADDLARGLYRTSNVWLAVDGDTIAAHAIWWTMDGEDHPLALDSLAVADKVDDKAGLAAGLLTDAHRAFTADGAVELPGLEFNLDNDWRDDPDVARALDWRREALHKIGMTDELERIRFLWTSDSAVPSADNRLRFTAEPDDEAFYQVYRQLAEGSLDVSTRKDVARFGFDEAVRRDFERNRSMPGDRSWWRVAHTADGEVAGMVMPSANDQRAVIAYIGVVPEQRGNGYVDALLAEGTRILADTGVSEIVAHTDVTNTPMAAAFTRAGYQRDSIRLILDAPAD